MTTPNPSPEALAHEPLRYVLERVLAQLFQSYGLQAAPAEGGPKAASTIAVIGFEGPRTGVVTLRLDDAGAAAMATALLGGFPPESEAERNDALGEWVNITAGNLKTQALDPRGTFRLGLPVVGDGRGTDAPPRGIPFRLPGDGGLEVGLVLDPAA